MFTVEQKAMIQRTKILSHNNQRILSRVQMAAVVLAVIALPACQTTGHTSSEPSRPAYFDIANRDDALSGGVRLIPIATPKGTFRVWTKRVGNNPRLKVLLLHGGPGGTHEYFEAFDSFFPAAGIEYYYYDQLGSVISDQPKDPDLWDL